LEIFSQVETVYVASTTNPVIVYPNPVAQNSQVKIIVSEIGRYTIRIIDINGKVIQQQLLNSSLSYINTGMFAKGVYLIQVLDKDGKQTIQKLIIH
jgi:hypothetical protein